MVNPASLALNVCRNYDDPLSHSLVMHLACLLLR